MARNGPTVEELAAGVRERDPALLGRAVTLVESTADQHREDAAALLDLLLPDTGRAHRVGVTGPPGVGKSTLIDALGVHLIDERDLDVAVLAVDPSSTRTGGSILGDKTRMADLARSDRAYVRPSPSAGTLGGVARATRETMLLVEAAGFDVVLVETVGVGQSEVTVAGMVDTFLVLALPGAGDSLQGIKKGVLELADVIAVTKADGEREKAARVAARDLETALHILQPEPSWWTPEVLRVSAQERTGLDELWDVVALHRRRLEETGRLEQRRREQQVRWLWAQVEDRLLDRLRDHHAVADLVDEIEHDVAAGRRSPGSGAQVLLDAFLGDGRWA